MALFIQCVVLCVVFTLLVLPAQFNDPLSQILSYPPKIRQRVESLPQYRGRLPATKRRGLAKKLIGTGVAVVALAALAWFSGKRSFGPAFFHVFFLFLVVNLLDLLIFDLIVFRNSKRLRIPGTEDMVAEYKNPVHHIKGAGKGVLIGTAVALLSGGLVQVFTV